MEDYIDLKALSHFLNKLFEKFAKIKHTHAKSEITDLKDSSIIATDDNDGNVTIVVQ